MNQIIMSLLAIINLIIGSILFLRAYFPGRNKNTHTPSTLNPYWLDDNGEVLFPCSICGPGGGSTTH